MKARSKKGKGNRFEYYLRDYLKENLDADTRKNLMSGAGYDKGDLRIPSLNIVLEAKNAQTVHLLMDWEQAKEQALGGDRAVLAIRNPKKPEFQETLIVMDLGTFIELAKGQSTADVKYTMDYQDRRRLQNLVSATKEVLNKFGDMVDS